MPDNQTAALNFIATLADIEERREIIVFDFGTEGQTSQLMARFCCDLLAANYESDGNNAFGRFFVVGASDKGLSMRALP
jgi:hypothetical protein